MKSILVVDDDANVLSFAKSVLKEAGYPVETCGDLAAARRHLQQGDLPGLVLLDLRLPDGSGLQLLPDLISKPESPRVLLFSRWPDEVCRYLPSQVHGVIRKLVAADELRQAVAAAFLVEETRCAG